MNLQLVVLGPSSLYKELAYVLALVTLSLHDFSTFWMLPYSATAGRVLRKCLR